AAAREKLADLGVLRDDLALERGAHLLLLDVELEEPRASLGLRHAKREGALLRLGGIEGLLRHGITLDELPCPIEICLRELVKRPGFVRRVARDVELEAKLSISKTRENRSLVDVLTLIDGVLDDVALDRGRDDAAPTRLERSEKRHRRNDVALGRQIGRAHV